MYEFSGLGPEYELGLAFQSSAKKDIVVNPLHYVFGSVPSTPYGDSFAQEYIVLLWD